MITSIVFSQVALPGFSHAASIIPPWLYPPVGASRNQVTLTWSANPPFGVNGYRLHWGQASGNYTNHMDVGNILCYTLGSTKDPLQDGKTYYFVATAYGYDSAGQLIESGFSNEVSQTLGEPSLPPTCGSYTITIWANGTVPNVWRSPDYYPIEVGVKFKSDVNGVITGIRFYKDSSNTGTHVGNLWSSNGTLLATATFANETPSGWQQVSFPKPVAITANTVYVASYHTNTGHYIEDQYAFSGKGVDNPPLHVLTNGASGPNGVYVYNGEVYNDEFSSFPYQSFRSSNYWVDVVFHKP